MQAWLDGVLGLSNTRKRGSSPGSGQGASASGTGALQQALHTLDNNLVAACNARQLDLDFGLQDRATDAASGQSWAGSLPLQLMLGPSTQGSTDLQMQLFTLIAGSQAPAALAPGLRLSGLDQGVLEVLGQAASLVFLQLALPIPIAPALRASSAVGCLLSLLDLSSRLPWLQQYRRQAPGGSAGRLLQGQAVRWVVRKWLQPSALLTAGAAVWRIIHRPSFHVLRCLGAAMPLQIGYAQLAHASARGTLQPAGTTSTSKTSTGPEQDERWRAQHRKAARSVAHLMVDVYDEPPLGGLLPLLDTASFTVASPVASSSLLSFRPGGACLQGSFTAGGRLREAQYQQVEEHRQPQPQKPPQQQAAPQQDNSKVTWGRVQMEGHTSTHSLPQPADSVPLAAPPALAALRPTPAFHPGAAEHFATSGLPTVQSQASLDSYNRTHRGQGGKSLVRTNGESHAPYTSPFQAAAAQQFSGEDAPSPGACVPFTTPELRALDVQREEFKGLALYGRGDHKEDEDAAHFSTAAMTVRGSYLLLIFLPFLLLGPMLLLLAQALQPRAGATASGPDAPRGRSAGAITQEAADAQPNSAHELQTVNVTVGSSAASPATGEDPQGVAARMRLTAWQLMLASIKLGGAAFIKWGQWSATREDMFPKDLCGVLAELHDHAPVHGWAASKASIEEAFGKPVDELFEQIDHKPLASGSVAQVHLAKIRIAGALREVVVKVRHPGVERRIAQDFRLLVPMAALTSRVKSLRSLNLKGSLEQFSATMTAQTDLRVEAVHLRRFFRNFVGVRQAVTPPFPLPGYESESVLVETFEAGKSVSKYIGTRNERNTQIVALGVDAYLKMLLHDNFVHTDLHPGNILVRPRMEGPSQDSGAGSPGNVNELLQLILLDFGLAEELTPTVRRHFISLLHMIGKGDGARAGHHMLCMSKVQGCPDPAAFQRACVQLFVTEADIHGHAGIDLDKVMKSLLGLARQYEVSIDSSYAALVVGVCVIVGFASNLDPNLNLMNAAVPAFFMNNLTGRIIGQLYA